MPPNRGSTSSAASTRPGGVTHYRKPYPDVDTVLKEMRRLAKQYKSEPLVRDAVQTVTAGVDLSNRTAVARAVWSWIREHVRYVRDPTDTELLQSPDRILAKPRYADCDGMSVLAASLLSSVGIESGFRALAFERAGAFDHVYAIYDPGSHGEKWHALDATVDISPGPDTHIKRAKSAKTVPLDPKNASSDMGSPTGLTVAGSNRTPALSRGSGASPDQEYNASEYGPDSGNDRVSTTSTGGGSGTNDIIKTGIDELSQIADAIWGGGSGGGGGQRPVRQPSPAPTIGDGTQSSTILGMSPMTLAVVGVGGTATIWMISEMTSDE